MKRLLLAVAVIIVTAAVTAVGQNTKRPKLKVKETTETPSGNKATIDTIATPEGAITLSGYDKPLQTRVETIFVTNNYTRRLHAIRLIINYTDLAGRQLHSATRWVTCDIPPGETRMITFGSWDRQQSFYYRHSRRPVRASGTAYDVTVTIPSIAVD